MISQLGTFLILLCQLLSLSNKCVSTLYYLLINTYGYCCTFRTITAGKAGRSQSNKKNISNFFFTLVTPHISYFKLVESSQRYAGTADGQTGSQTF